MTGPRTSGKGLYLARLPSEGTTVGLLFWGMGRLFAGKTPGLIASVAEVLAWCAIVWISAALESRLSGRLIGLFRTLTFGLGIAFAAWIAATFGLFPWSEAAGFGILLGFTLIVIRRLQAIAADGFFGGAAEGVRWAILQLAATAALLPYVRPALVGAGDAFNYGLSLADFTGQLHAGVFPIFVGQTQYAFNGNIHPLRTAPYFAHLGGLLDLLTLQTLAPYALLNLTLICSAALGTTGSYAALRVYSKKRPWLALGLALLYLLSPAFMSPLYEGDMIATFMAFPMIPWLVLGIALAVEQPDELRPSLLQALALAALWWAHPPIAFWASAFCMGAGAASLIGAGVTKSRLGLVVVAVAFFACLSAYEFASVVTLGLPPGPDTRAGQAWTILENIRHFWVRGFLPISRKADSLLGDVQLGYSLIFCVLVGTFVRGRGRAAGLLSLGLCVMLLFLLPIPGITRGLWSLVPRAALDVTNAWPMQRLYPVLSGVAVFAAWAGLSRLPLPGRARKLAFGIFLLGCLAWSAFEARKLLRRGDAMGSSPEQSAALYAPGNIALTRVSYMFFGRMPAYFSGGPMQPLLETRLLDAQSLAVVADGTSMLGRTRSPLRSVEMKVLGNEVARSTIPLRPWESSILRFDFLGRQPAGELQVTSRSMFGLYRLPTNGGPKSFGADPGNSRVIEIRNDDKAADTVDLTFVPASSESGRLEKGAVFAHVGIEPEQPGSHDIELISLLPFHAIVRADREAVLETPKMDIPGYRAFVNGRIVETVRTAEGLVGIPLPTGKSDARLEYFGPPALRWSYSLSGLSWLALLSAWLFPCRFIGNFLRAAIRTVEKNAGRCLRVAWIVGLIAVLAIGGPWLWRRWIAPEAATRRLVVMLPLGGAGQSEPLVEIGRPGAADVVYVRFLGGNQVVVGYDKWGFGASESPPFKVDVVRPQTIDISMPSLGRAGLWGHSRPAGSGVTVRWNGRDVLAVSRNPYPRGMNEVFFGGNPAGATSCNSLFMGRILRVVPVDARVP